MGATPHRCAQAASERKRSGLSPAATSKEAAVPGQSHALDGSQPSERPGAGGPRRCPRQAPANGWRSGATTSGRKPKHGLLQEWPGSQPNQALTRRLYLRVEVKFYP